MKDIYNQTIASIKSGNKRPKRNTKFIIDCSEVNFYQWFFTVANSFVQDSYPNSLFKLDDENENIIEQVYFYITCDDRFNGDLHKGLVFCGGFGTGKTIMCKTIAYMYRVGVGIQFKLIDTEDVNTMKLEELQTLYKKPLILDELGRNFKEVNDYGTKKTPFATLLTKRNENNAFTLGTANYNFESLAELYGEYLTERLKQQFNFIDLKGNSRRK